MGYESKVYIVEKSKSVSEDKRKYAQVVATFDMCKMGDFSDLFQEETDCYFFADDGNTKVLEDRYGDAITEAPIEVVIDYLEEFNETREHYRRILPLLGLLKSFDLSEWSGLTCLHFGY